MYVEKPELKTLVFFYLQSVQKKELLTFVTIRS